MLIDQIASEESKKQTSRLLDAVKNPQVWHLAIIYMLIQISVYGLIFFLPTQVAALIGTTVGFKASLVAAIPWVAAMFGTYYIPRYSDKTGNRRNVAAITLCNCRYWYRRFRLRLTGHCDYCPMLCCRGFYRRTAGLLDDANQHVIRRCVSCGYRFCQYVRGNWRFLAPIIRVKAETAMDNSMAGLLTLAGLTVIGALAIMALKKDSVAATQ
ncbi:Inner membrane transport protein RhmT [Budvicia aquatica]|uniref:Inner membrane transport protein RhmT n=1 Tax=Budvicia aquatica TaxID=82979 RepID=A0A484ZRL2_9GAMM|nr:Inner membrane transport protein RhmT [Budvicia aquatica]